MNIEIFEKRLKDISKGIKKKIGEEEKKDNNWWGKFWFSSNWPTRSDCLQRKGEWAEVKKDIEKRIELIKEERQSFQDSNKSKLTDLLDKYWVELLKAKERVAKSEAQLDNLLYKKEHEIKKQNRLFLCIALLIFEVFVFCMIFSGKLKL